MIRRERLCWHRQHLQWWLQVQLRRVIRVVLLLTLLLSVLLRRRLELQPVRRVITGEAVPMIADIPLRDRLSPIVHMMPPSMPPLELKAHIDCYPCCSYSCLYCCAYCVRPPPIIRALESSCRIAVRWDRAV
jgi:hypothetical protein